ncbi:MAG: hypothetical protein IKC01_07485 [Clostridia bacterium]|nr:hypothetical protein [Clostridia bacterium]
MKKMGTTLQSVIGFTSIFVWWCVGALCYEYTFVNFNFDANRIFHILPTVSLIVIFVLPSIFSFIAKRKGLNALYYSALVGVGLPTLAYWGSHIFSDDGNILSWIYYFSLGLLLYPFHRLACYTFDGVGLLYPDRCAPFLVVGVILSFVIFKKVKKEKTKAITEVAQDNTLTDVSDS